MRKLVLTESAKEDIQHALRQGGIQHGLEAKSRYALLIKKALLTLATDTNSVGVRPWDESRYSYHLRFSKHEAILNGISVKSPSHRIFFKFTEQELTVLRMLHETSDFKRHL